MHNTISKVLAVLMPGILLSTAHADTTPRESTDPAFILETWQRSLDIAETKAADPARYCIDFLSFPDKDIQHTDLSALLIALELYQRNQCHMPNEHRQETILTALTAFHPIFSVFEARAWMEEYGQAANPFIANHYLHKAILQSPDFGDLPEQDMTRLLHQFFYAHEDQFATRLSSWLVSLYAGPSNRVSTVQDLLAGTLSLPFADPPEFAAPNHSLAVNILALNGGKEAAWQQYLVLKNGVFGPVDIGGLRNQLWIALACGHPKALTELDMILPGHLDAAARSDITSYLANGLTVENEQEASPIERQLLLNKSLGNCDTELDNQP